MSHNLALLFLSLSLLSIINVGITAAQPFSPETIPTAKQLQNIIEALNGAGDFVNWAGVLSLTDPSTFPITATLFIPSDDALSHLPRSITINNFDPSLLAYHIVPQQFTFSNLQDLEIGSRIPTLLPNKTILVTNNSRENYSINDCNLTRPDLYINGAVAVHGIGSILNYTAYNDNGDGFSGGTLPRSPPESPEVVKPPLPPVEDSMGSRRSDAPCSCTEFSMILTVLCAVSVFKIYRNTVTR